jgi:hypothetical protein
MTGGGAQFQSREDLKRIGKAVRAFEEDQHTPPVPFPDASFVGSGDADGEVWVKVTSTKETNGYPGVFCWRINDATPDDTDGWFEEGSCLVEDAHGLPLALDFRYKGRISGVKDRSGNTTHLVTVTGGAYYRFLDDVTITGITCTDGEITAVTSSKTYKWNKGGKIFTSDPGSP